MIQIKISLRKHNIYLDIFKVNFFLNFNLHLHANIIIIFKNNKKSILLD